MSADDRRDDRSRNDRRHGDPSEPDRFQDDVAASDDTAFPNSWVPWGGGWGWGRPSGYEETETGGIRHDTGTEGEDGWWDEGLYTLLIVVGAVLFFFPEPATSMLGVLLFLAGAGGWIVDALR